MGRQNLAGDWMNFLSATVKQTSQIFYSQFSQVAAARCFVLVKCAIEHHHLWRAETFCSLSLVASLAAASCISSASSSLVFKES